MAIDDCKTLDWESIVPNDERRTKGLPLAQTCRALREELLPYFLKTRINLYWFSIEDGFGAPIYGQWFRSIEDKYRCNVRGVVVDTEGRDDIEEWIEKVKKVWGVEFKASRYNRGSDLYEVVFI